MIFTAGAISLRQSWPCNVAAGVAFDDDVCQQDLPVAPVANMQGINSYLQLCMRAFGALS